MDRKFSTRSKAAMKGLHPDLIRVLDHALQRTPIDFGVSKLSVRTEADQKVLVESGKSKTMRSRHIPRVIEGWESEGAVSCAADLIYWSGGKITWDWADITPCARIILASAKLLYVPLEWGGDWKSFKDGPHFQLPWDAYKIA